MVLPQLVRNADRFRHVIVVLGKHGLADWLSTVSLPWLDRILREKDTQALTTEQRIRVAMTELGTTFIKLGQVLSTRPDLVGKKLADELAQLRSATPADDPAVAREIRRSFTTSATRTRRQSIGDGHPHRSFVYGLCFVV